ncbi:hypothetical protein AMPC_15950 [Anaeromyxobacter paludicola]|uniref:Response regulatory domain-containing protein n=2 Tax=Anaeromyxobacter paludicola TaxID=2918171 RepID=A0ABN6N945_9BACT|nr:hypothetical protein AMPC_15950 [Anaeromyxobacter paludicola]
MVRIGEPEPQRLADAVERLCGEGYLLETARSFEEAERVRLVLTLRAEPHEPVELEGEVLRRVPGEDGARRGVMVWIPPDRESDRARLLRLVERVREGGVRATRTCRVLVVEDNALVRRLYAQAMERVAAAAHPVEVLTEFVENGGDAYDRLRQRPMIDLVLADLYMPVVDGFELLRRMHAEAGLKATPVVVLTAGGAEAAERAHQLGAETVMQKPVRIATIAETVGRLLQLPQA